MAAKQKARPAAVGARARGQKAPSRGTTAGRKSADPLQVTIAERDALKGEIVTLKARIEALTAVHIELESRLEGAIFTVQKLLGR